MVGKFGAEFVGEKTRRFPYPINVCDLNRIGTEFFIVIEFINYVLELVGTDMLDISFLPPFLDNDGITAFGLPITFGSNRGTQGCKSQFQDSFWCRQATVSER